MAINARVTQGQAVRVEVNKQTKSDVQNINYGLNALAGANDMAMGNYTDGYYIRYDRVLSQFYLSASQMNDIDGGNF